MVLSLSPSLQLAALSPIALAMPHNPLFRGGRGGFSTFVGLGTGGVERVIISSHTLSTIPVRTNAQSVHVVRRRERHQPVLHKGYIVTDWLLGLAF